MRHRKDQTVRHATGMSAVAIALLALGFTVPAFGGTKPSPPQSSAFGKTLDQWQDIYVRWEYGNLTVPTDANGNAVVGHVVLMPYPATPGDGTPGHLDLTLSAGEAFVIPLLQFLGTSYTDGTPDDPFIDLSFFETTEVTLQIDGVTVIDNRNAMDYFTQFRFNPPIALPADFAPLAAIIWMQGFGFAHSPLSVGTHTMRLNERSTEPVPPNFGGGSLEFHNTWTITVLR